MSVEGADRTNKYGEELTEDDFSDTEEMHNLENIPSCTY